MYKVGIERYEYIDRHNPKLKENKIALLDSIVMVYNHNNNEVDEFLNKSNARKVFNDNFSFFNLLFSKLNKRRKIKIILYRINPKLERFIQNKVKK